MLAFARESLMINKVMVKFVFLAALGLISASLAFGQETQTKVVDEVVVQVNNGVITLSRVKREMNGAVDSFVEQGKSREEAKKLVDERQGELIANLINEELLVQRAKELGLDKEIDQSVNERLASIMKQYNIKTVEALYAEMEKQGVNPAELKENWRKAATRDLVIQREVQSKIYWASTSKDLKDYYEAHKAQFTTPATVSFSELFLGFAGRDESQVRQKAKELYDQLKAGGDFDKIVKENGDRGVVSDGLGKVENAAIEQVDKMDKIGPALRGVKPGDYTLPVEIDQMGMVILRVDGRQAASTESVFDENRVRMAITNEKAAGAQKDFMAKLRGDAYIKVGETYRPMVSPLLFADERKTKTSN